MTSASETFRMLDVGWWSSLAAQICIAQLVLPEPVQVKLRTFEAPPCDIVVPLCVTHQHAATLAESTNYRTNMLVVRGAGRRAFLRLHTSLPQHRRHAADKESPADTNNGRGGE